MFSVYEFFAGGGMARAGLGSGWDCLYANDIDEHKADSYIENWGSDHFHLADVKDVTSYDLKGQADLLWASFPCQDLSLAGLGNGLRGEKSSTVAHVWRLISDLSKEGRRPRTIVYENVCGLLTSRNGQDFRVMSRAFDQAGYWVGAIIVDAQHFVPQSRKRIFFIGIDKSFTVDPALVGPSPDTELSTPRLVTAVSSLPQHLRNDWLWFKSSGLPATTGKLIDILEPDSDVAWDSAERTSKFLSQMSPVNCQKVERVSRSSIRSAGALFRRTRVEDGRRVVRSEVRFDGLAGCLRTPNGGSSKQTLLLVEGNRIRSRLLTGRETGRLMGLANSYILPDNHNKALHLTGDGVVVPVVRYISESFLEPIITGNREMNALTSAVHTDGIKSYAA